MSRLVRNLNEGKSGDVQKNLYFMHNKAQDNLHVWIHTEQRMTINNKDHRFNMKYRHERSKILGSGRRVCLLFIFWIFPCLRQETDCDSW